jgi:hypothetical protein
MHQTGCCKSQSIPTIQEMATYQSFVPHHFTHGKSKPGRNMQHKFLLVVQLVNYSNLMLTSM